MVTSLRRRLFNIVTAISTLALCLVAVVWMIVGSRGIDPRTQFISFSPDCHLTMWDHRLALFNDSTYGPYSGSIIGMSSGRSNRPATRPAWPKVTGFGDTAGIYDRHILWEDGTVLWTLTVSMWYALGATTFLPLVWIVLQLRQNRHSKTVEHHLAESKSE